MDVEIGKRWFFEHVLGRSIGDGVHRLQQRRRRWVDAVMGTQGSEHGFAVLCFGCEEMDEVILV
jgi:hypothetical protein